MPKHYIKIKLETEGFSCLSTEPHPEETLADLYAKSTIKKGEITFTERHT